MRHLVLLLCLILLVGTACVPSWAQSPQSERDQSIIKSAEMLDSRLRSIGRDYDVYFTCERVCLENGNANEILFHSVSHIERVRGLVPELESLRNGIPNFDYAFDRLDAAVIHVRDKRLTGERGYALDVTLSPVRFGGSEYEFVEYLAGRGVPLEFDSELVINSAMRCNPNDTGHVDSASGTIREVITGFLPRSPGSDRILWVSRTQLGGNRTTLIQFWGRSL